MRCLRLALSFSDPNGTLILPWLCKAEALLLRERLNLWRSAWQRERRSRQDPDQWWWQSFVKELPSSRRRGQGHERKYSIFDQSTMAVGALPVPPLPRPSGGTAESGASALSERGDCPVLLIPLQHVPRELLANRRLVLSEGRAVVPLSSTAVTGSFSDDVVVEVILGHFVAGYRRVCEDCGRVAQSLAASDERFREFFQDMATAAEALRVDGESNLHSVFPGKLPTHSPAAVDAAAQRLHLPLCAALHAAALRQDQWLHYYSRRQHALFLKGIGFEEKENVKFWQWHFSRAAQHAPGPAKPKHRFAKYSYGLRYIYGKEGKCEEWKPFSCHQIMLEKASRTEDDSHGCPFSTLPKEKLEVALRHAGGLSIEEAVHCAARLGEADGSRPGTSALSACKAHFNTIHQRKSGALDPYFGDAHTAAPHLWALASLPSPDPRKEPE